MEPADLELFTTKQLIAELLRRQTFQGVVIHAEDTPRTLRWDGERFFQLHFNANLTRDQICNLLGAVADYVQEQTS